MQERMTEWKSRLANLQHNTLGNNPKISYIETVLTQAESFESVGQHIVAESLLNRLDKWAVRHGSFLQKQSIAPEHKPFANTFSRSVLENEFNNLTKFFVQKQVYIPKPDKDYIAGALAEVKSMLHEGEITSHIQQQLNHIKSRLFDRLHRSLRAQFSATAFLKPFSRVDNQIGPYNNANNLAEVCKLISERDAIWIDDLIQLYGSLFKLEDKVALKKSR